jgi:hypothetical protein
MPQALMTTREIIANIVSSSYQYDDKHRKYNGFRERDNLPERLSSSLSACSISPEREKVKRRFFKSVLRRTERTILQESCQNDGLACKNATEPFNLCSMTENLQKILGKIQGWIQFSLLSCHRRKEWRTWKTR